VDERARRVGRNEALFRTINEEIEKLEQGSPFPQDDLVIVCECGDLLCDKRFAVPVASYEDVRGDSSRFFVLPGHEKPDVEDVVAKADAYFVVRKHPGGPARLAEATDPRSRARPREEEPAPPPSPSVTDPRASSDQSVALPAAPGSASRLASRPTFFPIPSIGRRPE
jgi:hypothetical protein